MTNLDRVLKAKTSFCQQRSKQSKLWFSRSQVWVWDLDHKGAECCRIDAFKLWCWRRLLRVPWKERRWNQSVLKEINPEYSLEGLMLKLQYFGHLIKRADSVEKTLMLGKTDGKRRGMTEDEMVGWYHQLYGDEFEQAPGVGDGQGSLEGCSPWGHKELDMTEWLNWTELMYIFNHKAITYNGLQYIVNKTFIGTEKPKYLYDSLHCVFWNQIHSVSQGCL